MKREMNTNTNTFFDFPDLPMCLTKPDFPDQQCLQQFQSPAAHLSRRWSCGDSQHAVDEPPAPFYHNLGFSFNNPFQMSNPRYLSDFDCPPNIENASLPPLPPYDQMGSQEPFSPNPYGNSMLPDHSFYENGPRSISAPTIGNPGMPSSLIPPDSSSQNCSGRRRYRTNFTEHQSMFLEESFKESHYPDHKAKKYMATYLSIPEDRITVWFQNRRAKWRRKEHRQRDRSRTESSFSGSSGSFDFHCFSGPGGEEGANMAAKVPMSYDLPPQHMSHDQFQVNLSGGSPEYPHHQHS